METSGSAKQCTRCGQEKILAAFAFNDRTHKYRRSMCRECTREEGREKRAAHRKANPLPPAQREATERTCVECGQTKAIGEFPWADKKRGFRRRLCKLCYSEVKRTRRRPLTEAEKEAQREYHKRNRGTRNAARMQRYRETPKETIHKRRIMTTHKISSEEYDKLMVAGVCAICGEAESRTRTGKVTGLCIDHKHVQDGNGPVRGLLCSADNSILGYVEDDIDRLLRAAVYLRPWVENDAERAVLMDAVADYLDDRRATAV